MTPPPGVSERLVHDHASRLLVAHEVLLRDGRRNRAFAAALKARVTPGSSVLDIGSGSGVWAILAAKLGARRVVAVEADPMLAGLIRALAVRNGVERRVEVVTGDSRRLFLPREFDVIVSETIGNTGFEEDLVAILADARERFGRPGAALIPEELTLLAAPLGSIRKRMRLPLGIRLDFSDLESLLPHAVRQGRDDGWGALLAAPEPLTRVDLRIARAGDAPGTLTGRWKLADVSRLSGFGLWPLVKLAEGVHLDTRLTSSWTSTRLAVGPFRARSGELGLEVSLTGPALRWSASLDSEAGTETQTLSPALASTALLLLRSGVALSPGHPHE